MENLKREDLEGMSQEELFELLAAYKLDLLEKHHEINCQAIIRNNNMFKHLRWLHLVLVGGLILNTMLLTWTTNCRL